MGLSSVKLFPSHSKGTPRALAWFDSGLVCVGVNQE